MLAAKTSVKNITKILEAYVGLKQGQRCEWQFCMNAGFNKYPPKHWGWVVVAGVED